ncbi:AAA family ATPase [Aquifex sp.]
MFKFSIEVENFLAIKSAKLHSDSNITFIIAPNRAGKTQIMLFLYTFFWNLWYESRNKNKDNLEFSNFIPKLRKVFLIKKTEELISWGKNESKFTILFGNGEFSLHIRKNKGENIIQKSSFIGINLKKSPIYISPAGFGDYYKGILAMKKYYENGKLISAAITDFLYDLFILSSEDIENHTENEELIQEFQRLFQTKFYIKNERIYVNEKDKSYSLEKSASGLKSISPLYLILKYNLLGEILFIDEPEVNLHPEYIYKLSAFLYKLSKNRKIFIATHSDYLLESFNKFIKEKNLKVDVWIGKLEEKGAVYHREVADKDNLIDTSPLNEVYLKIVKELFGYDKVEL